MSTYEYIIKAMGTYTNFIMKFNNNLVKNIYEEINDETAELVKLFENLTWASMLAAVRIQCQLSNISQQYNLNLAEQIKQLLQDCQQIQAIQEQSVNNNTQLTQSQEIAQNSQSSKYKQHTYYLQTSYIYQRNISIQYQLFKYLSNFITVKHKESNEQQNAITFNDKYDVDSYVSQLDNETNRNQTIQKIYSQYVKGNYNDHLRFICYQFVQTLLRIDDQEFTKRFSELQLADVDDMLKYITTYEVYNTKDLTYKSQISRNMESSFIFLNFTESFQLADISDETWHIVFDGVEKRLQYVCANTFFIVVRRVSDGFIFRSALSADNDELGESLKQFNDDKIYDVIVVSTQKLQYLEVIRIRYLNCVFYGEITLKHPNELISTTLYKTNITNLSECTNLENLYSLKNTYDRSEIQFLYNLKRVLSSEDSYINSDNCMIKDLLERNKMQYIYAKRGKNIVHSVKLSTNISNLTLINAPSLQLDVEQLVNIKIVIIYQLFVQKYINKAINTQHINLYDRQWLIQQIGKHEYYRIQNILTFMSKYVDKNDPIVNLLTVLMSNDSQSQKENAIQQLFNNVKQQIASQQYTDILDVQLKYSDINEYLKQLLLFYSKNNIVDLRINVILQLYHKYQNDDVYVKYNAYSFIKYLLFLLPKQFTTEFNVNTDVDVNKVVQLLKQGTIHNSYELTIKQQISKCLECSYLYIDFDNFNEKCISEQVFSDIFQNIENRIQYVSGSRSFIIVRVIADNKVIYRQISSNESKIQEILSNYKNKYCDVVLVSHKPLEELQYIKLRHLNYINTGDPVKLKLRHPEDLENATLQKVAIENLGECENLQNLCSKHNVYGQSDLESLFKLLRFCSSQDTYEGEESMLQMLLWNNSLQYVEIYNIDNVQTKQGVLSDIELSQNIQGLKFLYIKDNNQSYNVKINIREEYPARLQVFSVQTAQVGEAAYEAIEGNEIQVTTLHNQLMHNVVAQ